VTRAWRRKEAATPWSCCSGSTIRPYPSRYQTVSVHHGDIVVTMDNDPPTKQRTIRLDLDIDERLTAYARRTRRTVNATVNFLLGEALQGAESDLAVSLNQPVRPLDK
jgi:hypothetical protein